MEEKSSQSKKQAADQDRVINIGDINSISRGTINISGEQIHQEDRTIDTGGSAYIGGNVNTGGGDFVGRDQYPVLAGNTEKIAQLFEKIYAGIEAHPDLAQMDKEDLMAEVKDVQIETAKGDEADESFLIRRLHNIQRMVPDIFDLVLSTLISPASGFSVEVRAIAARIKDT
jgi:hypothetical protein